MKKTINLSIGGLNFQIEEDAYQALEKYLGEVKTRFVSYPDAAEIVSDMEDRIAEQFSGKVKGSQPISLATVEELIAIMGRPDQIGEAGKNEAGSRQKSAPKAVAPSKHLYRNPDDAILAGVCSGIAAYLGTDTVWVRLIFALTIFFGGFGVVLYIILWVIVPPAETDTEKLQMRGSHVNLKNLEQTVKDRVAEIKKKDPGQIKRGLSAPFRALGGLLSAVGRFFLRLLPVVFKIVGVAITIVAALAMAGLVFLAVSLLTNSGSPYLDFPLKEIASGTFYYLAVASAFFVVFVPIIFIMLIGTSLVAYRSTFAKMGSFMLLGLWVVAVVVFANMAVRLAPQVESLMKTSPYFQTSSKEYAVKGFSALEIGGIDEAVIYPGNSFKVTAEGKQKDISQAKVFVENNTLKVEREHLFKVCLFCTQDKIKLVIYAPELKQISGSGASRVSTSGALKSKSVKIKLSGVSEFQADIQAEAVDADLSGASKLVLAGFVSDLKIQVSGAGKAEAGSLQVKSAFVDLSGAAKAYLGDVEDLKIKASGASTVYYHSAKILEESYSGAARAIKAFGDAIQIPEPDKNETVLSTPLVEPVSRGLERITKKPFGLLVSPQDSPVSPERFSGYHTGTDFETFSGEQQADVEIFAICDGVLVQKRAVSGYGGVAVQQCVLLGQDVTVVYGHLKFGSINSSVGEKLVAGSKIGLLGKGFSSETDGERKHLHLGIHIGREVNLAGYVKKELDLANWLDAAKYLK